MAIDIIEYRRSRTENTEDIIQLRIEAFVPTPTDSDYNVGYIKRYFVQKVNDIDSYIFEINSDFVESVQGHGLYKVVNLKWRLTGTPQQIIDSNSKSIEFVKESMPKLSLYLPNLLQFVKID